MLKIYNTLSRSVEEFKPIDPAQVGMYTCGPTVYHYPTIGNYRTYTTADILLRALKFLGFQTRYVMNLTDVGHLTGDNSGDADIGEDRLEKASKRENKSAWDIAKFYSEDFINSLSKLNLTKPDIIASATDHISEQIELIKKLEINGMAYQIDDGIYFDTVSYEDKTGEKYGVLSDLDQIKEGARVEPNPQKKNPRDFALWKFSPEDEKRQMEWDSPWGKGFPGWHIECSAMSMKYLGEQFDIHVGGIDLKSTHHPNEIAQSQGATGKIPFVKYWIHGAFLTVDGGRMGKSLGNSYALHDIKEKGFDLLSLRYLYLQTHYRAEMNFTWESLEAVQTALNKLREEFVDWEEEKIGCAEYEQRFMDAINDDLNMPKALSVVWEMVRSDYPGSAKKKSLLKFDEVLGLGLKDYKGGKVKIPQNVKELVEMREKLRKEGKFKEADKVRARLESLGFEVEDLPQGSKIKLKH